MMSALLMSVVACNKTEEVALKDNSLYLFDLEYDKETLTIFAQVKSVGDEKSKIAGVELAYTSQSEAKNIWYNHSTTEYILNPKALYSAVDKMIPQDDRTKDDVLYTSLKVVFRYDTIYTSVESNGDVVKNGRYYRHRLLLDKEATEQKFVAERDVQNSANWYSTLICAGIFVLVLGFAISSICKRKTEKKSIKSKYKIEKIEN
ncbi:MAG: hypothetical protein RSB09_04280 [Clostridia bacterium]